MPVIFLWLTAKVVRGDSLHVRKTLNSLTSPKPLLWEFILCHIGTAYARTATEVQMACVLLVLLNLYNDGRNLQ